MRTPRPSLLLLLAGALALGACDDAGTVSPGDDSARLSIFLTDAPGDFEAAVVTITDIYLQPGEGEDAQRVYLLEDAAVTTNLLELSNDALELVESEIVPEGTYEQLRFVITGGYIAVENESGGTDIYASSADYEGLPAGAEVDGELHMPSYAQSGLKVRLPGADGEDDGALTIQDEQKILLIDFDVSQSFGKQAGNSGRWVMRPSLEATDFQTSGSIDVAVTLADSVTLPVVDSAQVTLADFSATLTPAAGGDAKVVALADEDGDGVYAAEFVYLFPGDYALGIAGPDGLTITADPAVPQTVTLGSGAEVSADFTITSVVPVP